MKGDKVSSFIREYNGSLNHFRLEMKARITLNWMRVRRR